MSGTGALRLFDSIDPPWDTAVARLAADPAADLDRARDIAARADSEIVEAHHVLDEHGYDHELGETLTERLTRVLGPRLRAVTATETEH